MERLRGLGRYQIALLVCGVVMILVFSVLYPVTTARVGFLYQDTILTPAQEGDATVYSGKLRGEAARFTVHADKSVEFQYGDKTYGPYTVTEDPDARPDSELSRYLTGVEVRCGDTILFRGGVMENGGEDPVFTQERNALLCAQAVIKIDDLHAAASIEGNSGANLFFCKRNTSLALRIKRRHGTFNIPKRAAPDRGILYSFKGDGAGKNQLFVHTAGLRQC